MPTLESLRRQMDSDGKHVVHNGSLQHWNIPTGESVTVRFREDGDVTNPLLWRTHVFHEFPDPDDPDGMAKIKHTSPLTFGEKCPINEAVKPLWNTDKELARKLYIRRHYVMHGHVDDAFVVCRFTKQIHDLVKSYVEAKDTTHLFTDPEHGRDFIITKTKNGEFNSYSTSRFSMQVRALSDEERAMELPSIASYLPAKPTKEDMQRAWTDFEAYREALVEDNPPF